MCSYDTYNIPAAIGRYLLFRLLKLKKNVASYFTLYDFMFFIFFVFTGIVFYFLTYITTALAYITRHNKLFLSL